MNETSNIKEIWITTKDNPFDPFTQFDDWNRFDQDHNYNTCQLIDRHLFASPELSDSDQLVALDEAIKWIIDLDPTENYIRVTKESKT